MLKLISTTALPTLYVEAPPTQRVYTKSRTLFQSSPDEFYVSLLYTTTTGDINLGGLSLNIHYDSSLIEPVSIANWRETAIKNASIQPDTENQDWNPNTDKIYKIDWITFDNSFPSSSLPASLGDVVFKVKRDESSPDAPPYTTINFSSSEKTGDYEFASDGYVSLQFAYPLDISDYAYSNDPQKPTPIAAFSDEPPSLSLINTHSVLIKDNVGGDYAKSDYITFEVPAWRQISSIVLVSYVSESPSAFIAIQEGSGITADFDKSAMFLGSTNFGPGSTDSGVGVNLIDKLGGPLREGTYSMVIRQDGEQTDYVFNMTQGISDEVLRITETGISFQGAAANGKNLALFFSDRFVFKGTTTELNTLLDIRLNGEQITATAYEVVNTDPLNPDSAPYLLLNLKTKTLIDANTLTVAYQAPSGNTNAAQITDKDLNPLATFTSTPVENYATSISNLPSGLAKAYKNLYLLGNVGINGYGNEFNNRIQGNGKDNILYGRGGDDFLLGDKGNDTYWVEDSGDTVVELENEGTDTVRSSVSWVLGEHLENLVLTSSASINGTGNNLKNKITGNDFANVLDGGGDQDTLIGGKGSDTYIIDHLQDKIIEVASKTDVDTVLSSVTWTLGANLEHLTLTGTSEINGTGNSAPNTIIGNAAKNLLDGGAGGKDRLTGGEGGDGFTFSSRPTKFLAADADVLTDFSSAQGDKIRLKRTAFGISPKTGSATLTFASTPTELAAELETASMFIYDTSEGHLYWNQNGVGANAGRGGVIAVLENKATLSATDLILF